ncbi:hypothetical protein Tco_1506537 [Tanacetum coccineum]
MIEPISSLIASFQKATSWDFISSSNVLGPSLWKTRRGVETLLLRWVEVGSCKEWDQECSCSRDHSPPLGEELEKVNRMTQCQEELELGDDSRKLTP